MSSDDNDGDDHKVRSTEPDDNDVVDTNITTTTAVDVSAITPTATVSEETTAEVTTTTTIITTTTTTTMTGTKRHGDTGDDETTAHRTKRTMHAAAVASKDDPTNTNGNIEEDGNGTDHNNIPSEKFHPTTNYSNASNLTTTATTTTTAFTSRRNNNNNNNSRSDPAIDPPMISHGNNANVIRSERSDSNGNQNNSGEDPKTLPSSSVSSSYESLRWMLVTNDGTPDAWIKLIGLKSLFAKQLPKMPRSYIARLVFDVQHTSLVLLSDNPALHHSDDEIIGSICYRNFPTERFAEIAFCAVHASHQVKGYGTKLMNLL